MKAAIISRYGPPEVLRIMDVDKRAPKAGEIAVRVHASTVCAGDIRIRKADPFFLRLVGGGLIRPSKVRTPGMEYAGMVEAVGDGVKDVTIGDEVFGSVGFRFGACAEHVCATSALHAAKPANITQAEAAAIPFGGVSALHFLRAARLQAGQRLLVYGASGSVGTAAVQLGKHFGAHVTGVCSGANAELVRSLGADAVIDYATGEYSDVGPIYDVVFDTVGKSGMRRSVKALKPGGVLAFSASPLISYVLLSLWASLTGRPKIVGGIARGDSEALRFLVRLVEQGQFRPVIDRTYALSDIVEAHRYVEAGHKRGNVVVVMRRIETPFRPSDIA